MNRAVVIAVAYVCFMAGLALMDEVATCYTYGSSGVLWYSGVSCPDEPGTNVSISAQINSKQGYTFSDSNGVVVSPSELSSVNSTLQGIATFNPLSFGTFSDIFGLSWVLAFIRIVINAFFMPLFGLPEFLTGLLGLPAFIVAPFGYLLFLTQCIGAYMLLTGRGD